MHFFVLLCDFGVLKSSYSPKSHSNTNKLTDRGSSRPAIPVFCEVKLLFLSMESGGFEESLDQFHFQFSSPLERAV